MRTHFLPIPLLALGLLACGAGSASDGEAGLPYRTGVVERGDIRVFVEETGVVEPERQIVVKSPISGVVQELEVREGDKVRNGQLLARIIPDIAQANAFAQMHSELARARIARDNAKLEYDRAVALMETDGITRSQLDQLKTALDQAENALAAGEGQLRLVERSGVITGEGNQWARIAAPASGVIILRGVEEGETVTGGTSTFGGGTELFTIADLSALKVTAAVNEVDIGRVSQGDSVAITVDAFPGDTVMGVVRLVPPAARLQDRVRVFDVEVAVADGDGVLRPGMTANVRITGPARTGVVRVPVEAVFLSESEPVVYRVSAGEYHSTPVRLGLGDLSWVEVVEGVAPGDTVALEDPVAAIERANRVGG